MSPKRNQAHDCPGLPQRRASHASNKTPGTVRLLFHNINYVTNMLDCCSQNDGTCSSISKPFQTTRPTHISPQTISHTLSTNATIKQHAYSSPSHQHSNPFLPRPRISISISTHTYTMCWSGRIPPTTGRIPDEHESMLSVNGVR